MKYLYKLCTEIINKFMQDRKSSFSNADTNLQKHSFSNSNNDINDSVSFKQQKRKLTLIAVSVILGISGLLTLSYLNGNIFMEKIAISGFIIICVTLMKILNDLESEQRKHNF